MRHEKALELAVVFLLAAAGASIALGVYESSSHRSAGLWWALATAAFLAALLIPLVWFGVHPLFVLGREWAVGWQERSVAVDRRRAALKGSAEGAKSGPLDPATLDPATLDPATLEILRATYGVEATWADVAEVVRRLRADNGRRLNFQVTNQILGDGDPAFDPVPGQVKTLTIQYRLGGIEHSVEIREGQPVNLP